jgi:hypothetical protein
MAKKEATENVSPATAAAQALNAARWSKKSKAERSAVGKSLAAARWGNKPPVSETGGRKSKTGS